MRKEMQPEYLGKNLLNPLWWHNQKMADKIHYFMSFQKLDYPKISKYTWNNPALFGMEQRRFQVISIFSFYDMANSFLVKPITAVNKKKTSSGSEFRGLFQFCFLFSPSGYQGCWNLCWRDPLSSSVNLSASSCWIGKGHIITTCCNVFLPICLSPLQYN